MSYKITTWAWQQDELPSTTKFVLLALADYADTEKGECWPSVAGLATKLGFSPNSRPAIRRAIADLEQRGLITKTGRVREGTREQTSHLYRINWRAATAPSTDPTTGIDFDPITGEVGAENTHVGVQDTGGGCSKLHESVTEPITEPITSPTPSTLRDDAEKKKIPCAVNVPSTAHESPSGEGARELVQTSQLRAELRTLISIEDEDEWTAASDDFLENFEDIYRGRIRDDAGDLYWNRGFHERLDQIIRDESKTRSTEDAISYGIAKWLSIFTNTALDITR